MVARSILVVDDDAELGLLLSLRLAAWGHRATVVGRVSDALALVDRPWAAALVDLQLPDGTGADVLRETVRRGIPTLMLTAHGTVAAAAEAMRQGACAFVSKPFHDRDLREKLEKMLAAHGTLSAKADTDR